MNMVEEYLAEMACQCVHCTKGIMNPTELGTMYCDKCEFECNVEFLVTEEGYDFLKGKENFLHDIEELERMEG